MTTLTINGSRVNLECPPNTPLLWAIRDCAGLKATRPGCLLGLCGACTVQLDGRAVRSCSIPVAQAEGRAVTTIEGVLRTPLGRALQCAWSEGGLRCCAQCRPGRIMAAAALLARCASPSDKEVEAALGGHVCECGELDEVAQTLRHAARIASGQTSRLPAELHSGPAVDPASSVADAPISGRTDP
jgi:isoquinoline 1-oxidoreductase alpha subunit